MFLSNIYALRIYIYLILNNYLCFNDMLHSYMIWYTVLFSTHLSYIIFSVVVLIINVINY